jgi:hypothetical protein
VPIQDAINQADLGLDVLVAGSMDAVRASGIPSEQTCVQSRRALGSDWRMRARNAILARILARRPACQGRAGNSILAKHRSRRP